MDSIRVLLAGLVDYAGLFPPASLSMEDAVEDYARYRRGPFDWVLARFILPAAGLEEFGAAMDAAEIGRDNSPWRLSALAGENFEADIARVLAFNNRHSSTAGGWTAAVDSLELKAATADQVRNFSAVMPGNLQLYVEVPVPEVPASMLEAAAENGARAKIRTGGTSPDLFPSVEVLAKFLHGCSDAGIPFKATAGLHHPLRGNYPLTGDSRSPRALMHGFLNVFVAAALVEKYADAGLTTGVLEETSAEAFQFEGGRFGWRNHWVEVGELLETRRQFALSFGSCSFEQPVDELESLGLLR
jgi:hypothetical protein